MQEIKQSIINQMPIKAWSVSKAKWHDQVFEVAKSDKKIGEHL